MAHANEASRALAVAQVDHAMQGMRRLVTRPPSASVPMPGLGRPVDLSKVLACEALAELSRSGPVTITDLSTATHLERSTVSRLVGEAEAEGLVERSTHPDDGRMVTVTVTALGQQVVDFVQGLRVGYLRHATDVFSDEEIATLADLLGRLAESMLVSFEPWLQGVTRSGQAQASADSSEITSRTTALASPTS
ncbi:MAG: MarR family winged helix-turn-helix transcriptional regulator [Candidatus Nanopelagicales bacterium]